MAVTPFKTFVSGEVLTASDLNSSITTITSGGMSLISPATTSLDMDGFEFILDADADSSIHADTDDQFDFKLSGTDYFRMTAGRFMALSATIVEAEGAAVASAGTTDIWANDGNTVHITGTTTITSFGTAPQGGAWRKVIFDGALTLTHGANLSLQGSANITTAADDIAFVYADTTTQFDVLYFRKDGSALAFGSITGLTAETAPVITDTMAIYDDSAAANRKVTLDNFYKTINGLTADSTPDTAADYLVTYDASASGAKKVLYGTSMRKQGLETIWVPAVAMYTRTTNGAASGTVETGTSLVMRKSFDFDTTTQEFVQFAVMFPKSWNESTVTFAPVWTAASGSGGVVFGLAGVALSDDDALNTAFGTAQTSTDTLITAADIHVGPTSSAITIAGTPAAGDWVVFQLNRTVSDGSDTLGVDANLLGVRLFFTTDSPDDS